MKRMYSTFEWRRLAVAHWRARADNARFSAFLLWKQCETTVAPELTIECGYKGTPHIALYEAYLREADLPCFIGPVLT